MRHGWVCPSFIYTRIMIISFFVRIGGEGEASSLVCSLRVTRPGPSLFLYDVLFDVYSHLWIESDDAARPLLHGHVLIDT